MAWRVITVSEQFLAAIRAPHQLAIEVTATSADGTQTITLPVEDGTITIDRTADHRRHLDLTISDPTLYPSSTSGVINVYGTTITVKRGITYGDGQVEVVQLGVFRVEDASRDLPGGPLQITGWDASRQVLDQRFLAPRKFGTQLGTDLIKLLISEVYDGVRVPPAAVFNVTTTDTTMIHKHVVDRDRWPEVLRVAAVIGVEVFADVDGTWIIQDIPNLTTAPSVWDVDAGANGVLVSATDSVTREGAPNVVVTLGETFNGRDGPVVIRSSSTTGRGAWSSSTAYSVGDGVQDGPTEWVAIQAGTNHQPTTSPSFWNPAVLAIVDMANHEVVENQQVSFHTGGSLPHPLTQGTTYFVHAVIDKDSFHISGTRGGSGIATTASTTPNATIQMDIQGIPVHSTARDTNPQSPTYYLGPYGSVPRFYSSPHIKTQSQADRVAAAQLADHIGATRLITFNSVPNPALDAGDCITVVRPDGTTEKHLIDVLTIGLGPSGVMTGETRAQNWSAA